MKDRIVIVSLHFAGEPTIGLNTRTLKIHDTVVKDSFFILISLWKTKLCPFSLFAAEIPRKKEFPVPNEYKRDVSFAFIIRKVFRFSCGGGGVLRPLPAGE